MAIMIYYVFDLVSMTSQTSVHAYVIDVEGTTLNISESSGVRLRYAVPKCISAGRAHKYPSCFDTTIKNLDIIYGEKNRIIV